MKMLINKVHFPVEVLGPGRRVGIWVQGCTIRCFGCISRDTWPVDRRFETEIADVLNWIAALPQDVDGVTISGGEPFEQPDALMELLEQLHVWRAAQQHETDILAFSGLPLEHLQAQFAPTLAMLDALIAEPFVLGEPTDLPLRGSANQRLVVLSELGRERYTGDALERLADQRRRVQLQVDDESIWMIGIPKQHAMRKIQARAASNGIEMRTPSWLV
jgi:anaerobic ribonucleoside-triphosphate reductase activating protein